uniref:Uncharacterized protein n=2 Tax=Anguilla anguilla TaxID=7936 RepID=A0A0E9QEU8_ANGAN
MRPQLLSATYFSNSEVQPGTNPGSRVNHSKVIKMKKMPVTTSGSYSHGERKR